MTDFVIEAQQIPGPQRHEYIFNCFDNLAGGESLVIVNTHDPIPLLRQLSETKTGQFQHEYLEQGPSQWRLKITKNKKESCCGFCGG
jgi:uncharacterized protein (DUF2249 family)